MMLPLAPKPGINTLQSRLLVGLGWAGGGLVRFKDGLMQKLGGWLRLTNTPLRGICRGLFAWTDLDTFSYLACGTTTNLELYYRGSLYDITERRLVTNTSGPFTVTAGTKTVSVADIGSNARVGDMVNLPSAVALGGLVLQGWYSVTTAIGPDNFTFVAVAPFLSNAASAGTTAAFTTTNTSSTVTVTLANHGLSVGGVFTVGVSTSGGGLTLFGAYTVVTAPTQNTFTITAGASATSSTTFSENSGNVRIIYPVHAEPSGTVRNWWLDNWGEFLMSCYTNGPIGIWTPPITPNNVTTRITQAPDVNAGFFIAMPARIVVAFGCTDPLTLLPDPVLVRWSTVDDYTVWTASATNQAGSFRLASGSYIVGALQAPMQAYILTDIELWTMTYIGFPLIFNFQKVGWACGLLAPKAMARIGNVLIWMGRKEFFIYDGSQVRALDCPVWGQIFPRYDRSNVNKIFAATNGDFSEISFFFPVQDATQRSFGAGDYGAGVFGGSFSPNTATGNECGEYVKLNIKDGFWDYGSLIRTAWTDQSVLGDPIGADGDGLLQQHEISNDADNTALESFCETGWIKIANGDEFVTLLGVIPDFVTSGGYNITMRVYIADYPNNVPTLYGPYTITETTQYVNVWGRGRLVYLRFDFNALGTFSRVGQPLLMVQSDGQQ